MAFEQAHLEELTVGLYDRGVLMFGDFVLKSGRKSPLYYNQRKIASFSRNSRLTINDQRRVRDLAVSGYSAVIDELGAEYDHLYGIPQALTSLGAMVAQARGDSILWGRVGEKSYGAHVPIEGDFAEGDSVVSLDDVITNAASKIETAESLGKAMLMTRGFVVMFDREEGGAQKLEETGHDLVAVTGLGATMEILRDAGRIGAQELELVAQYQEGLRASGLL